MLTVNGKVLLLKDKAMENDEHVKIVKKCLDLIKQKAGKQIILDWVNELYTPKENEPHVREHPTGFVIPCTTTVLRDGGTEIWVYSNRPPKMVGTTVKHQPKFYKFLQTTGFNGSNADLELLYYLVFISPFCEKIPSLQQYQNPNPEHKLAYYRLLLPELEAQLAVEMGKKTNMIGNKIYNELSFEQLKKLAQGTFEISGTDNMQESTLKVALHRIATSSNENMEKFLMDFNINPFVELKADVMIAIEKRIVAMNRQFGRPKWCYITKEGKMGDAIINVPSGETEDKAKENLVDFYKTHPEDYKNLQEKLAPEPVKKKSEIDT
jgi:hypothetical protein